MLVSIIDGGLVVKREANDPKYYNESILMYHVKNELIKQGYNVIKKLMYKDGNLVSDTEYYIRDRKSNYAFWFSDYALRFSYEDFNSGQVIYNGIGDIPQSKTC
jgi:hypothetical protein